MAKSTLNNGVCCKRQNIIKDNGDVCCTNCGTVFNEKSDVEEGTGTRDFTEDGPIDSKIHTGQDYGFASNTLISNLYKDASGNLISGEMKRSMNRLATWDRWSHGNRNKRVYKYNKKVKFLVDKLGIRDEDEVITRSIYKILERARDEDIAKGRSIDCIVGASAYYVFREKQIPRTLEEIEAALNVRMKSLTKSYRILLKYIDQKMEPPIYIRYINRVISHLETKDEDELQKQLLERISVKFIDKSEIVDFRQGKRPTTVAPAVIYFVKKHDIHFTESLNYVTQKNLAEAGGVTEVTIRERYKGIREALGIGDSRIAHNLVYNVLEKVPK